MPLIMKKISLSILIVLLTISILTACNLPTGNDAGPSLEDQAGTLVAQTLTAAAEEQPPTETRVPANTPTKPRPTVTPAPSLTPTATSQLVAPEKPSLENYNFTCAWNGANLDLNITIQWSDKAISEEGYYVYRNSQQIADLAPNSVNYIDLYAVDGGTPVTYAIEAYNNLGRSEQIVITVKCE